jgi:chromosome segregation ATPase
MNSDMPRTNNAAGDGTTVPADFAADLERELATAKAEVERANADLVAYRAEANALEEVVRRLNDEHRAEVERLREELARLKEAIPAVLTHIDDIGARGYYSGKTLEEDAAIEGLRAALKVTK